MVSTRLLASLLFSGVALANNRMLRRTDTPCTSDDACKKPCAHKVRAEGINLTPSEEVIDEARRRFSDAHCIKNTCSCDITSDDQAKDFCKYWIENDKQDFNGALFIDGGMDADKQTIHCTFTFA